MMWHADQAFGRRFFFPPNPMQMMAAQNAWSTPWLPQAPDSPVWRDWEGFAVGSPTDAELAGLEGGDLGDSLIDNPDGAGSAGHRRVGGGSMTHTRSDGTEVGPTLLSSHSDTRLSQPWNIKGLLEAKNATMTGAGTPGGYRKRVNARQVQLNNFRSNKSDKYHSNAYSGSSGIYSPKDSAWPSPSGGGWGRILSSLWESANLKKLAISTWSQDDARDWERKSGKNINMEELKKWWKHTWLPEQCE